MPDYSLFPSIIPEANEPFVDDSYSQAELERMGRNELQQIASAHESEDVHGQMSNDAIISFLIGEKRV